MAQNSIRGRIADEQNAGVPFATAGGLVFIAATPDEKIHAYDQLTGDLLWEYKLSLPGMLHQVHRACLER